MRSPFLRRFSESCLCIAASALIAPHAFAMSCPSPAPLLPNAKVNVIYDPSDSSMKACVGSTWITLSGSGGGGGTLNDLTDVVISSPTANQALVYNGASWTNTVLTVSESDPQVGTLNANKWCASNAGGTAIDCTQDAPSFVESDPTIGTLTNGKWCSTDGSVVSCVQDAPVASAGADTQVIFNSSGTLTGDASFVWDNTNKRLGVGTASPVANLHVIGTTRFDGVDELNWSGFIQGNQTVSVTFTHNNQASFEITAVMNHYGYINTYGCARKAIVANGSGVMDVVNIVNITSANGGSWTFTRNSATSVTVTKTAGSYVGGGDYFITVRGAQNLSK